MQRLRDIPVHSDGLPLDLIGNIDFSLVKSDIDRIRFRCGKLHQRLLDHAVSPAHSEFQDDQFFSVIFPYKVLIILHFILKLSGLEKHLTVSKIDGQRAAASGTAFFCSVSIVDFLSDRC